MELSMENLTKVYKDMMAVDHITCTMNNGVYGLLGVNGAGKTTLMRMICTLLKPTEGRILYDGKEIWQMDGEYRKVLGYLPQDFGYYPDFSAEDYLMYVASLKGLPAMVARKRVQQLLHKVGMEKVRRKKMKRLSGGMKRRIGIAQAMLNNPGILVLDEPTSGLDPNERIRFRNLISELSEERLVILSTHIVSDVEYIANEILLMKDGKLQCSGTPAGLLESMEGRVWQCTVPKAAVHSFTETYKVANMKTVPQGVELRVLSGQKPCAQAVNVDAALEDVFLYHFGEQAGDRDGLL